MVHGSQSIVVVCPVECVVSTASWSLPHLQTTICNKLKNESGHSHIKLVYILECLWID